MSVSRVIPENDGVDVDRLRAETRNEHEATEALVPLMDADLTREQYAATLRRMYLVVHGWEVWAADHVPEQFQKLLVDRQRSHLIQEDLSFLGAPPADRDAGNIGTLLTDHFLDGDVGRAASIPDFLGAMYVMEGSTLGGQHIARYVEEKLAFAQGEGDAYFRGYLERTGSMWQNFKQNLIALPESDSDAVIAAAKFMFQAFGKAMTASNAEAAADIA